MKRPQDEESGDSGATITTPPVYLRLQKRAQVQSAPQRTRPRLARWRRALLAFFGFFAACCLAYLLARRVESDARFRLHNIELRGAKYVSALEVEEVFYPDRDQSIYFIPLEARRRAAEQIPWVHSATVTRVLPDHLAVTIEERVPVAFLWTRRGIALVDGEGMILHTPEETTWTFPVLRGVPEKEPLAKRQARLARYQQLAAALRQTHGEFPQEISEVDLSDVADLCLVVTDAAGAVRLHLGDRKWSARFGVYRSHIAEWRQQFSEVQSIDLRYDGQVVIQSRNATALPLDQKPASLTPRSIPPKRPPLATTGSTSRTAP